MVDDDHLGPPEGIEALPPKLAPKARGFPAAKGQRVIVDQRVVDPDEAGVQPFDRLHRLFEAGGENRGAKTKGRGVCAPDRRVEIGHADNGGDRAETFLVQDIHRVGAIGEDRRGIEPTGFQPLGDATTADQLCPLGHSVLDQTHHLVARRFADQRSDLGLVEAVANPQRQSFGHKGADEIVMHGVDDKDPLGRGADLTGQMERRRRCPGGGDVQRRIGRDDHRIAAPRLDHRGFEPGPGGGGHGAGGGDGAGEGHGMGAVAVHQSAAKVGAARQAGDQTRRQAPEHTHEIKCAQGGCLGRFDDAAVPGGQRRRHRPAHQQDRKVERHDMGRDAQGFIAGILERTRLRAARHLAGLVPRHFGVIAEHRRAVCQLTDRLGVGFAHLAAHQDGASGEILRLDPVGQTVQMLGPGLGVQLAPAGLCRVDRGQHMVDLSRGRYRVVADRAQGCRVGHRKRHPARGQVVGRQEMAGRGGVEHRHIPPGSAFSGSCRPS